jgi:hypothetical protein
MISLLPIDTDSAQGNKSASTLSLQQQSVQGGPNDFNLLAPDRSYGRRFESRAWFGPSTRLIKIAPTDPLNEDRRRKSGRL